MTAPNRRQFLKSTAIAGTGLLAATDIATGAFAAGDETLKIGLIGCGGRGTGAAAQALNADANVKLTAMGDAFEDRLEKSLKQLRDPEKVGKENVAKVAVPKQNRFVGFDAYKKVIASGVDVVLLTTPPHFRPMHLQAAIDAGKHVFAEKPVAVDAPGVRSVLKTCEEAKRKNLSVVSGLCLRYDKGFQELTKRIHDGEIGRVITLFANDYRGPIWMFPRKPEWTDMHWQMRNWYYFTWLSGDFNVEQHVHYLDTCAWAMGGYPEKAVGMGGRQVRTGKEYGHIYDHHAVVYEYENGARLVSNTRQQKNCWNNMSAQVYGSKGTANFSERRKGLWIDAATPPLNKGGPGGVAGNRQWTYTGKHKNMYQVEHDLLFAGIRNGKPMNNGEYMAKSTLLAIMGRMATYTGQEVTWKKALHSQERLGPEKYAWGDVEMPAVAVPGVTRLG